MKIRAIGTSLAERDVDEWDQWQRFQWQRFVTRLLQPSREIYDCCSLAERDVDAWDQRVKIRARMDEPEGSDR